MTVTLGGIQFEDLAQSLPQTGFFPKRDLSAIRWLVVHHTAGPATATPHQVALYHLSTRGWAGIGYHVWVAHQGWLSLVGDLGTTRANVLGHNTSVVGFAMPGDFTVVPPPTAQLFALAKALVAVGRELPQETTIVPHSNFGSTACPGNTWDTWWPTLLEYTICWKQVMAKNDTVRVERDGIVADALRQKDVANALKRRIEDWARQHGLDQTTIAEFERLANEEVLPLPP